MAELVAWVGNAFVLLGMYTLSRKQLHGFVYQCLGSTAYTAYAVLIGSPAVLVLNVCLVAFAARAYRRWVVVSLLFLLVLLPGCYDPEPCRTVTINQCPICGDWLVDDGYCTNCNLWFEVVGGGQVLYEGVQY